MSNVVSINASKIQDLETIIGRGLDHFVETGKALAQIRDERLYKERGFSSFGDYCRERWELSRTQADRLIGAAVVTEKLTPIGVSPRTESQARPLTRLPEDKQAEAWQEAVDTAPGGRITAAHVARVVNRRLCPDEPDEPERTDDPDDVDEPDSECTPIDVRRDMNREEQVLQLYENGNRQAEVARIVGCHQSYVGAVLRRHGVIGDAQSKLLDDTEHAVSSLEGLVIQVDRLAEQLNEAAGLDERRVKECRKNLAQSVSAINRLRKALLKSTR